MFTIVQRRYWYFGLSLLVIIPGLIALLLWGLPLSIDFTSGTLLEVQFVEHTAALDISQVRAVYNAHGFPDTTIQTSGADSQWFIGTGNVNLQWFFAGEGVTKRYIKVVVNIGLRHTGFFHLLLYVDDIGKCTVIQHGYADIIYPNICNEDIKDCSEYGKCIVEGLFYRHIFFW